MSDIGPGSRSSDDPSILKVLVLSVGGTVEPLVHSIRAMSQLRVVFFASAGSSAKVEEILGLVSPADHRVILTPDEQDLEECFATVFHELPRILKDWGVRRGEVAVDYTGGTKVMSAALALATAEFARRYIYVGGTTREQKSDGRRLGTVTSGSELMVRSGNPWMRSAVLDFRRIGDLARRCQFTSALEVAEACRKRLEPGSAEKAALCFLEAVLTGYAAWDRFRHEEAHADLRRAMGKANRVDQDRWPGAALRGLVSDVERSVQYLDQLLTGVNENHDLVPTRLVVLDLVANAIRRGTIEHKWDDAVARLYRASEAYAQCLLGDIGIPSTKEVPFDAVPVKLQSDFRSSRSGNGYQLGLKDAYRLLDAREIAEGHLFMRDAEEFDQYRHLRRGPGVVPRLSRASVPSSLDARNDSILAHGFRPVSEDTYEKFLSAVLRLLGIRSDDLPTFPDFHELGVQSDASD